jgi:hypothetical protein
LRDRWKKTSPRLKNLSGQEDGRLAYDIMQTVNSSTGNEENIGFAAYEPFFNIQAKFSIPQGANDTADADGALIWHGYHLLGPRREV